MDRELGGRYRVEARIGSGGMAEVFRGFDPVLNRTVAIKILNLQFSKDASFVERFRREAQAAARLNHPNIVGVYDHGSDNGTQYIVMEFIEGRTLSDALGAGRRPTPMQAAEVAQHICDGLAAAHAQGVIHRDIKPENVMVTRDGTIKVTDFGIARLISTPETAPQTSAVLGTASYLSPEQAQGLPVDARSDLYSLGAVLFEMLTGRPPFTGDSPVAIAYKQVNEAPVPPSQVSPDVPPALDPVVMRALAKNPVNRYQTAGEFAQDLGRVRNGEEVLATPLLPAAGEATQVISRSQSTQVLPPQADPPGSARKVWLGVLIGVLVVALLAGTGFFIVNTLGSPSPSATTVAIDNVMQQPYATAKAALEGQGLVVAAPVFVVNQNAVPGTVVLQSPAAGTQVANGSTVTLTLARGPSKVPVPDLSDMTLSQAQTALSAVNLGLGTKDQQTSDTVAKGLIISQSPPKGTRVAQNSLVDVVVSLGPSQITLPDVTCLSFSAAKAQLVGLGIQNVVSGGTDGTNPLCPEPDKVSTMSPSAGTKVAPTDTVTLFLNPPSPSPT